MVLLNVNAFPQSTYKEDAMKKLLALAAVIGLGMSTIGCEPAAAARYPAGKPARCYHARNADGHPAG